MISITPAASLPAGHSIVVPVYDSAEALPKLVARLLPVLQGLGGDFELLLVNDGSKDNSWQTITELVSQHGWIKGLCLMRNYGQHNALLAGIRAASFATCVTMDDDLQHPPEELPKLIARLDEGFDVIYGAPVQEQHGMLRALASVTTKLALQSAMGAQTARMAGAWRVFRTPLREAFSGYHSPFVSIDVLLTWATTRFSAVRVRHDPRTIGRSNYTFRKLMHLAVTMVTGFSVLPLQMASIVGFAFTLFGIAVLTYVLGRYLISGTTVPGFPFLASITAIFSGAQLFALGIIGEYLARIHSRTMEKPAYTIKETATHD